jgi:hypothetical protein
MTHAPNVETPERDNARRQFTGDCAHSTEHGRIQREASKLKGKLSFERRRDGLIGIS